MADDDMTRKEYWDEIRAMRTDVEEGLDPGDFEDED